MDGKTNSKSRNSLKKLDKSYSKLRSEKFTDHNKERAFIFGDSKVRGIKFSMEESVYTKSYYKGGATISDRVLRSYVRQKMHFLKPIFIFWLGTCEMTRFYDRKNKYVELMPEIDIAINKIILDYREFKSHITSVKSDSRVIFLECPSYNIKTWNMRHGHENPTFFNEQQDKLELAIKKYNHEIQELNEYENPHLSEDMVHSYRYGKGKKKTGEYINYDLLEDGIHPGKKLNKLWIL